jgi:hypothetical protein
VQARRALDRAADAGRRGADVVDRDFGHGQGPRSGAPGAGAAERNRSQFLRSGGTPASMAGRARIRQIWPAKLPFRGRIA